MTTINDISDLIRVLQEHPEWRQALRGIILDEDLTRLPQQVDERFDQVDQRFDQVDQRLDQVDQRLDQVDQRFDQVDQRLDQVDTQIQQFKAEVDQRFDQMDQRFNQMDDRLNHTNGRLDNMTGTNYEIKVEKNIRSVAPQQMGLRSIRVVHGTLSGMDSNLQHAIEQAADNGTVTWDEASALMAVDLIFEARTRTAGIPAHVTAEISITAGAQDVTRAKDRAQILEKVLGTEATPAVVCSRIEEHARGLAERENVTVALLPE